MMLNNKKKIVVGMSGGVDSSVAAAILLEKGYHVTGLMINNNEHSLNSIEDAKRVTDKLGMSLKVINSQEIFKKKVIDYFIKEYLKGCTPNPCVVCNRYVKFQALSDSALEMGFEYVATGHYARVKYNDDTNRYLLKKAKFHEKDQSYMLYNLTQNQLSRVLFPLGDYTKEDVRNLAVKYNLPVADKPDSQELCFVSYDNYGKYVQEQAGVEIPPGNFVDIDGNILGKHKGIIHYTVGQRRGLGIALGRPVYVVRINKDNNEVILGDLQDIMSKSLLAKNLNYISIPNLDGIDSGDKALRVTAKIRYSSREVPAQIYPVKLGDKNGEEGVRVEFDSPQKAVAPGQSVVFYDREIVIGGGVIV